MRHLSTGSLNLGDLMVKAPPVVAVIFLVVYALALLVGLLLARSITRSIHALSVGTEHLRSGDFEHRIAVRSRDQLGELAESFNTMSRGIRDLLRQQAEKERLEEELRIARQIQMSLLPAQGAVGLAGLRIAALCLPAAEVGGDYYDLLPLSETRMGVLVADVSGKGTSAALYMAELKGLVLSLSRIYQSPAKLLAEANRILAATMDSRSFITMTYALVDTAARTMRYARAGHNPIIHLEAATGLTRVLTPQGHRPRHRPRGAVRRAPRGGRGPLDQRRRVPLLHRRPLGGHERALGALRRAPAAGHHRGERGPRERAPQGADPLGDPRLRRRRRAARRHDDGDPEGGVSEGPGHGVRRGAGQVGFVAQSLITGTSASSALTAAFRSVRSTPSSTSFTNGRHPMGKASGSSGQVQSVGDQARNLAWSSGVEATGLRAR